MNSASGELLTQLAAVHGLMVSPSEVTNGDALSGRPGIILGPPFTAMTVWSLNVEVHLKLLYNADLTISNLWMRMILTRATPDMGPTSLGKQFFHQTEWTPLGLGDRPRDLGLLKALYVADPMKFTFPSFNERGALQQLLVSAIRHQVDSIWKERGLIHPR